MFFEFWSLYDVIEPKIVQEMLAFYQDSGIKWAANEFNINSTLNWNFLIPLKSYKVLETD